MLAPASRREKRAVQPGSSPATKSAKSSEGDMVVADGTDDDAVIVTRANAPPLWFTACDERMTTNFSDLFGKSDEVKHMALSAKQESKAAIEIAQKGDETVKQLQNEMSQLRHKLSDNTIKARSSQQQISRWAR